jgi:signal transduction histidine kinase
MARNEHDPKATPPAADAGVGGDAGASAVGEQLERLRFLHHVARLATTARTWDELLDAVVDGTRDALNASVSSLYLLDRDGEALTLAATNGLDRYQIGHARVPFGQGVTGRVAAQRTPMVIPDVRSDSRFLWVRGIDQRRFVASMLSVPLILGDDVVGVLNVQTEQPYDFDSADVAYLAEIAELLAGIVEKVRRQQEAARQVDELRALDQARVDLIALVTHELRTPLAVVRAYTDLLADDPPLDGRSSRDPNRRAARAEWHQATLDQVERLDRLVDSILASVRSPDTGPVEVVPMDVREAVDETLGSLRPLLRRNRVETQMGVRRHVLADPPRLRQTLEHLVENAVKYAPPDSTITIDCSLVEGVVHIGVGDEGPGIPPEWRQRIFEPYSRRDTHTARGSGIGLYAAKRLVESMGGRLWCEPAEPAGARFVIALSAAVAV